MGEQLTKQQQQAVTNRGGKLLVSAAAGSGKTKVLVDRLLGYIMDPVDPANIDDFLIITFTKAAASELREKIASKISERIAQFPENRHLHQQLQRVYLAKISTVHSFCTDILREFAYQLDLPADFRVADENECLELQLIVIEKLLDEAYSAAENDADFCAFIDSQGIGRDDRTIPQIILNVFHSANCHLDPNAWLDKCIENCSVDSLPDAAHTVWGAYLIRDLKQYLSLQIEAIQNCVRRAMEETGFDKTIHNLNETLDQLVALQAANSWDTICDLKDVDYGRLTFSKDCSDLDLVEQIKCVRNTCKSGLAKKLRRFSGMSQQIFADTISAADSCRGLIALVKRFADSYEKIKRRRRVLDFADLEHKMLDLVLGKSRKAPTRLADELGLRFREVMVDEYQDTNEVQDAIFSALTHRENNCFMVGDVKQSIYQFRLADPSIFINKYNTYKFADDAKAGEGRKVLLSSNFRSSGAVIHAVNDVFSAVMSPDVGGLYYGEEEQLKEGIIHPVVDSAVELFAINVSEDTYTEEANFVAGKIQQMLDGKHLVRDGDGLRPVKPEDIVILLRSPNSVGYFYHNALMQCGIPVTMGGNKDILHSEEIETLRALLSVINNPMQDIPLTCVLSSRIFCFTANDLVSLKTEHPGGSIYDALLHSDLKIAKDFLAVLNKLRKNAQLNTLSSLIRVIFSVTRMDSIYASLPDGSIRTENLQNFCQFASSFESSGRSGLVYFLDHLLTLDEKGLAATNEQGNNGCVTIMSIHKSKGLEFPVVFLCGLSRAFSRESTKGQVLCDKDLGLGFSCVDLKNRVRYPSVAKRAIITKILSDGLSEEMRVLYVAMTRAKDRLIMTYSVKNVEDDINELKLRMQLTNPLLISMDADCPGTWVLYSVIKNNNPIEIVRENQQVDGNAPLQMQQDVLTEDVAHAISRSVQYVYPDPAATLTPSKQTATQMKGREIDAEVAENAPLDRKKRLWRKPTFAETETDALQYGTTMHTVMQHVRLDNDICEDALNDQLDRLVNERFLTPQQAKTVNRKHVLSFFQSQIGKSLRECRHVIREFKFSILEDACKYYPDVVSGKILLQGVVDCAMIEEDGITVIDFKTDRVSEDTLDAIASNYYKQVRIYADALSRIYEKPIKSAMLYFFNLNRFVEIP